MLTYTVDGKILVIVSIGATPTHERRQVYEAIADDPTVPNGVDLLIDARRSAPAPSLPEVEARTRRLRFFLGPKLGRSCALIAPPRIRPDAAHFRTVSRGLGLDVEIFPDEPEARAWLSALARQGP